MIINSSTDPVLVKKIELNIWTLRDEIESIIAEKIDEKGGEAIDVQEVAKEYLPSETKATTEKPAEAIDPNEAAMADAIKAGGEESSEQPNNGGPSAPAQTTNEQQAEEKAIITQRLPPVPDEKMGAGVALLSEINMDAIYFFATRNFIPGQSVMIEFKVPNHFIISADIVFCRNFNMKSRVISAKKMPYRIGAKFTFTKEGERTLLRKFVSSIEPGSKGKGESGAQGDESEGGDGDGDAELNALLNG